LTWEGKIEGAEEGAAESRRMTSSLYLPQYN
jgi:hypothetical protein